MVGSTLSHYKIVEKIGEGGMGIIYKADDLRLNRQVAIKVLPSSMKVPTEENKRFLQEARITSSLNHPNILTVYEFDEADEITFIVTEFIEGQTLEMYLSKGQLTLEEILDISIQISSGIEEAHKNGIIHRDLKAENIMITHCGQIKVMDFGLARVVGSSHVTQPGNLVGTFSYMSPEQINEEEVDERSDIFSFGILLYRMITGVLPFQGKSVAELLSSIVLKEPEPIQNFRKDIPKPLRQIVYKALEKKKETRYKNIRQLKEDLTRIKENPSIKSFSHLRRKPKIRTVLTVLFLISVLIIFIFMAEKRGSLNDKAFKTIAVLPFSVPEGADSLSPLILGLTDDIIKHLVYIRALQVKPTSAVTGYPKDASAIQIGKDLKVDIVLQGRIHDFNDEQSLAVQLVDIRTENILWADVIKFKWDDLLDIEKNLPILVANALRLQLSEKELADVKKIGTTDPLAYELYLRGTAFTLSSSRENNEIAIKFLESAISRDEKFAEAYAALGSVYVEQFWSNYSPDTVWIKKGELAARKALELDNQHSDAYSSLGFALRVQGNYRESVLYAIKTLEINPNHSFSLEEISEFYRHYGDFQKALLYATKAAEVDPSFNFHRVRARINQFQGKYAESLIDIERAIRRSPTDPWLRGGLLAFSYIHLGDLNRAKQEIEAALSIDPTKPEIYISRAMLETAQGNYHLAEKELNKIKDFINYDYALARHVAAIYSLQNKPELAIYWLQKAVSRGNRWYSWYMTDSWFDNIRDVKEFREIMEKVKNELDEIAEILQKAGY